MASEIVDSGWYQMGFDHKGATWRRDLKTDTDSATARVYPNVGLFNWSAVLASSAISDHQAGCCDTEAGAKSAATRAMKAALKEATHATH